MVDARMLKRLVGLLTLMVVCGLAGCPSTTPSSDVGSDVVDLVETIEDVVPETVDIVVPAIPKLVVTVKEVKDPPCACPASGWCAVTRKDFDIFVGVDLLNKPEGGFKGVTKVSLLHTGFDGEVNVIDDAQSTVKGDDNEDYYPLYFQIDAIDTGTEYTDGVHELTVKVETDVIYSVGNLELPLKTNRTITVMVDTTPPQLLGSFKSPVAGEVYAQFLPVSYCLEDLHPQAGQGKGAGIDLESIQFSLVNLEGSIPIVAPEGAGKKCPTAAPLQFDVAQNNTGTYEFQVEVADCIGNEGTVLVPDVTVVGLPDYEMPSRACFDEEVSEGLGQVAQTRPVHLGTTLHGQKYAPDEYPDLVLFGSAGVAFAMNDGKGNIGLPEVVVPGLVVTDGYAWDVNGDFATDLVVLVPNDVGTALNVYLQDVHVNKATSSWEPTGVFPVEPTEVYQLSKEVYSTMDRYDVNGDGFDDLVAVGADDVDSGALLLHTGAVAPHPEEDGDYPDPDPEDPKTMAPDQPDHFVIHDKFQGVGGISDLYVGQFHTSAGGNLGPPEVVVVRPTVGLLTVITLDEEFNFGAGLDTLYCWGAATRIAKPAELRRGTNVLETDNSDLWDDPNSPGLEDLLLYSDNTKSLHFVPNKGGQSSSGYFGLHGESHPGLLCFEEDDPDTWYTGEVGFGQASVAGAVSFLYVQPPQQAECGYVVYVGEEPDKVWLGDVARSGSDVGEGIKDGILDIIIPVTGSNHVAFHPGTEDASYCAGMRVNPGQQPHACTPADFDLDGVLDMICVTTRSDLTDGLAECFSQFSPDTAAGMSESLPIDLVLPLKVDWRAGPVNATQFLVADVEEDGDNDIIVATSPELQYYKYPEIGNKWSNAWATTDEGGMDSASVPLILTYRLESGLPVSIMPAKSPVDLSFNQELSSVSAGDFDANGEPDLAVAVDTSSTSVCDGRTVDLLLGARQVTGLINPEEVGTKAELTSLYVESSAKGRFVPEGGFLLSQNVTGVMAAKLDSDNIDDLVVFFKEYGTLGEPEYQPHGVATFLTVHDVKWNDCAGNVKRPYFPMAPPYPPQAIGLPDPCDVALPDVPDDPPDGEIVLEYPCLPTFESSFQYGLTKGFLHPGQAQPSAETEQWAAGDTPVAGTVGDFYSADGTGEDNCQDFFVANSGSHNATFIRGNCAQGGYQFLSPVHLFPIGSNPLDIKTADLNHDDYIDTVTALSNQISLTYGVKGELFDSPLYLDKGVGFEDVAPIALAVEDVNDDGWVDLLVISSKHDSVLVYLNGGVSADEELNSLPHRTRFLGPFLLGVGANPTAILVAPLYTDLAPVPSGNCNDVAVLNSGSGTITLLRNRRCKK